MSPMSSQPLSKTLSVQCVCLSVCRSFFHMLVCPIPSMCPCPCLCLLCVHLSKYHTLNVVQNFFRKWAKLENCRVIPKIIFIIPCHAWLSLLYFTDKKSGNPPPLDYITITVGCPRKFALSTMAASPPMSNVVTFP